MEDILKLIIDISDEAYRYQNKTKKEFVNLPEYKNWIELFIEGKSCIKNNDLINMNLIKKDEDDDDEESENGNKKNKEYKRELDRLKKEQNKLNNENNNMLQENKSLKNELEDYKQSLDEYDDIVEQLKQARIKLDSLMGT